MANSFSAGSFIVLSMPAYTALACLLLNILYPSVRQPEKVERLRKFISVYFISIFLAWLSIGLWEYFPGQRDWFYPVRFIAAIYSNVLFYRLIFIITGLPIDKPFNKLHYLLPVVIGIIATFLYLSGYLTEYGNFTDRYISISPPLLIYCLFFLILSVRRIKRYGRTICDYTAQLAETNTGWLYILIGIQAISIFAPIIFFFLSQPFILSPWILVLNLLLTGGYILTICRILTGKIVILDAAKEKFDEKTDIYFGFDKEKFEKLMNQEKPFIDPNLTIIDLAGRLHTNRTYLSVFINKIYGRNFSTYINELRLNYLDSLRKNPIAVNKTNAELIYMAGFGSYQSYQRAKKKHNSESILKI